MVLSDEDIKKFQALFKIEFGIEISKEDAYKQGVQLLKLVSIIYKPMTKKEYEQLKKLTNNYMERETETFESVMDEFLKEGSLQEIERNLTEEEYDEIYLKVLCGIPDLVREAIIELILTEEGYQEKHRLVNPQSSLQEF